MIPVNDNKDELDELLISHKLRKIDDVILNRAGLRRILSGQLLV